MKNKLIQIGVIGSDSDLNDAAEIKKIAYQIGRLIAKNKLVLITSCETRGGLTTMAAMGALKENGVVIGVMGNKKNALSGITALVDIGTEKEGLREFFLINSCDAIIAIGGGSGTLNELTIAYQNKIPVVCITRGSGWAKTLAGTYLDKRKFYRFERASSAEKALKKVLILLKL